MEEVLTELEIAEILNTEKYVYLLGTGEYGPVNYPIEISSYEQAVDIFKSGSLIDAYCLFKENNVNAKVIMTKISGSNSSVSLNVYDGANIITNAIRIFSKDANEIFNKTKIIITLDSMVIIYPKELNIESVEFKYEEYKTLYDLSVAINKTNRLECEVFCDEGIETMLSIFPCNVDHNFLSGGISGINYDKNMLYVALNETYNILAGQNIDMLYLCDCYFDDVYDDIGSYGSGLYGSFDYNDGRELLNLTDENGNKCNFYSQLVLFCANQNMSGNITIGVIGFNNIQKINMTDSDVENIIKKYVQLNKIPYEYEKFKHLVMITYGDVYYNYSDTRINFGPAIIGMLSDKYIINSIVNKPFSNSISIYSEFSNSSLKFIDEYNICTIRFSPLKNRVVVFTDSTSSDKEFLHNVCNVRMIQIVMSIIKKQFNKYIGKDVNKLLEQNTILNDIGELLSRLIQLKIINDFVINSILRKEYGNIIFDIDLKGLYMLDFIKTYSGVTVNDK